MTAVLYGFGEATGCLYSHQRHHESKLFWSTVLVRTVQSRPCSAHLASVDSHFAMTVLSVNRKLSWAYHSMKLSFAGFCISRGGLAQLTFDHNSPGFHQARLANCQDALHCGHRPRYLCPRNFESCQAMVPKQCRCQVGRGSIDQLESETDLLPIATSRPTGSMVMSSWRPTSCRTAHWQRGPQAGRMAMARRV